MNVNNWLSCPHCDGERAIMEEIQVESRYHSRYTETRFYVRCLQCEKEGTRHMTKEKANSEWRKGKTRQEKECD